MADTYLYDDLLVQDENANPKPGLSGSFYAWDDVGYLAPLTWSTPDGTPMGTTAVSGPKGLIPRYRLPVIKAVWKGDGMPGLPVVSFDGLQERIDNAILEAAPSNIAIDTLTGKPFFQAGANDARLLRDTDGKPYVSVIDGATSGLLGSPTLVTETYGAVLSAERIPGWLNNTWSFNAAVWGQSNVYTAPDGTIYAAWVRGTDAHQMVGKKTLTGTWETFDLRTVSGDPLKVQEEDGHNTLAVTVDPAGYVWVAGNHHDDPLRLVRSANPGDITSWVAVPTLVNATDETSVTYPVFFYVGAELFFWYRQGSTYSGVWYLSKLTNPAAHTWSRVSVVLDGAVDSTGVYPHTIAVRDGVIHLMWNWRNGFAALNHDLCYAYSDDGGVTWRKSNGTAYALPIREATSEIIVDTPPFNSGLVNQGGLDVDAQGRPHTAIFQYDANGNTQIHHVWFDGAAWHNERVTQYTHRMETINTSLLDMSIARPSVVCTDSGRTYIITRRRFDGGKGRPMLLDVTDEVPFEFPVADLDLHDWEPTFDVNLMRRENKLRMLLTSTAGSGSGSQDWNSADHWNAQYGLILTVDMLQVDKLAAGTVKLPTITQIGSSSVPGNVTLTATSSTDTELLGRAIVPANVDGMVLARWQVRANLTGSSTVSNFRMKESVSSGTTFTEIGNLTFTSNVGAVKSSPWIPCRSLPSSEGGFVITRGSSDNAAGTRFTGTEILVGVLDY